MSNRKRIVIDASVLRAAGGENAIHPTSKHCRDVLYAVLTICHKAVLSDALREEWDAHQSKFAKIWRSSMQKRKKIIPLPVAEKLGIRNQVLDRHQASERNQEAALKDFHLIEAAIDTDRIVVSLDDTVRRIFAEACAGEDGLSQIIWVHLDESDILRWLESGAYHLDAKRLAAYLSRSSPE